MTLIQGVLGLLILLLAVVALYVAGAWLRLYGEHEGPGEPTASPIYVDAAVSR